MDEVSNALEMKTENQLIMRHMRLCRLCSACAHSTSVIERGVKHELCLVASNNYVNHEMITK